MSDAENQGRRQSKSTEQWLNCVHQGDAKNIMRGQSFAAVAPRPVLPGARPIFRETHAAKRLLASSRGLHFSDYSIGEWAIRTGRRRASTRQLLPSSPRKDRAPFP